MILMTIASFFIRWKTTSVLTKIAITINGFFMITVGIFSVLPTVLSCLDENRISIRIANYSIIMGSGGLLGTGILSIALMNIYVALCGYLSALSVIPYYVMRTS
jgi:hypothetical protein